MKAQKRTGNNKVPTLAQTLIGPHKPMQRFASAKTQHAHSRGFRPRPARCSAVARSVPVCFPGALCPIWAAPHTTRGGAQMISAEAIQHCIQRQLPSIDGCHMATDGPLSELHQMATQVDLRRSWFQDQPGHPHDDLTAGTRAASPPARRAGRQYAGPAATLLSADAGPGSAVTDEAGDTMTTRRHLPGHTPALRQPQQPVEPQRPLRSRCRRCLPTSRPVPADARQPSGTPGPGTMQEQQGVCRDNTGSAGNPSQAHLACCEPSFDMERAGTTALQLHLLESRRR